MHGFKLKKSLWLFAIHSNFAFMKCRSITITITTSTDINLNEGNSEPEVKYYNPDNQSNESQSNPKINDDQ